MRCPTLAELPPAPPGRTGWPWTEESPQLPDAMPDGSPWPRVSIVTPSYNQGQFIEETIRSVLLQGYPDLEYMVIDGGSTDGSVEIIRKYEPWLAYWVSEKDRGQSHAINKGWEKATGRIIAYLNSDDTYLPSALAKVAASWHSDPQAVAVVGAVVVTDTSSRVCGGPGVPFLPWPAPLDLTTVDYERWFLPQQPSFWAAAALDEVGRFLREELHYTMDRELYYRICSAGRVMLMSDVLATYRKHQAGKMVSQVLRAYSEDPRALSYCTGGGYKAAFARRRVARWRVGQGHYRYALATSNRAQKLWHLLLAAVHRPGYLLRAKFQLAVLDALRLRGPLRWAWRKVVPPRAGAA